MNATSKPASRFFKPTTKREVRGGFRGDLFQPYLLGIFSALALSEFVRGALTFSVLPTYGTGVLGIPVQWTALAISLQYLVDTIFRAPFGWMIDRIGPRYPLLMGFAAAMAGVLLALRSGTATHLILAAMLFGFGVSPMWPAAMAGIARSIAPERRASFVGYLYIFWLCGTGLGPVTANFLIARSYTAAFLALAAADALGAAVVLIFVHRARDRSREFDKDVPDGQALLQSAHGGRAPEASPRSRLKAIWRNVRDASYLFPGMFAQTFAITSLVPILSLYAKLVLHLSPTLYSSILVGGGLVTTVTLLPAGKLVDHFGPRRFLIGGFALAAAALILFSFYHTIASTFLVVAMIGLGYGMVLPSWNKTVDSNIDPDKKATLWGIFMTVEGIGSAVGPYIGGTVWDAISPQAPFWVAGSVILGICLLYALLPSHTGHARSYDKLV